MAICKRCGRKGILLKVNAEGLCDSCVQQQLNELRNALSPEQSNVLHLQEEINTLSTQRQKLYDDIYKLNGEVQALSNSIQERKSQVIQLDEQILLQEFGLYEPKYDFCTSDEYKIRLQQIRQQQKDMIKNGYAVTGNMNWTVNGSLAQGKKMVKDMQKLLLRAFNSECDDVIEHVKYNSYDSAFKRISSSCTSISKLGQMMDIVVVQAYYDSKIQELNLALEYRIKKQQEKEEQKEIRAQMREEARLQREIEEERKKAEKEQRHYMNALEKLKLQIVSAPEEEKEVLLEKQRDLEAHISSVEENLKQIDYREANQKAGYVYVISNIGSFGENIYKIGMTRRLEPMERIDELGDASVPFDFDVHAMIFSEDAPGLEAALHKAFENKKVNMVNTRREFFQVTLDEIKKVVKKNYDKTAEFIETADAEQYRISPKMRESNS